MKHSDFDAAFDSGEDITAMLDTHAAIRPNHSPKRVNVDFPLWMVQSLDKESERLGVTRQSLIKLWLAEKLSAQQVR